MKARLDNRSIRHPAPATGQLDIYDTVLPGFGLRIGRRNRSYFVHRGVRRIFGSVPPPNATPGDELPDRHYWPADARRTARELLSELAAGVAVEPIMRPKNKPQRPTPPVEGDAAPGTFKAVADFYLADNLQGGGANLANRKELERKLKVALKDWHHRPIAEIKSRDIRDLIRAKAQSAPVEANRLLSFVKRVFRWATVNDYIDADPAAAVSKPTREEARSRYLSDEEIQWFWRACDKLGEPAGRLYKLALVSAQRRGEVGGLRRSELGKLQYRAKDTETGREKAMEVEAWLLPPERVKRRKPHTVPLSALARTLIEGAPEVKIDGKITDHLFATGDAGDAPPSGWTKFKIKLDELIGREIAKEVNEEYDPARHALPDFHVHDLRATAATIMEARLGVPRAVVSRVLGHAEGERGSTTSRYVRHAYDAEAADALDRWAEELGRISGANVISLDQARS